LCIDGTIPYFMSDEKGEVTHDKISASQMLCKPDQAFIRTYFSHELANILTDAPENGFSIAIISALSEAHSVYARNSQRRCSMAARSSKPTTARWCYTLPYRPTRSRTWVLSISSRKATAM
jgi:hypothetical protein